MPFKVRFEPSGVEAEAASGEMLLDVAKRAGVHIDSICGGRGTCGRCHVRVMKGDAAIREEDRRHVRMTDLDEGVRLACQLKVEDDISVEVISPTESSKHVILERSEAILEVAPLTKRYIVTVPEASISAPEDLESRFVAALKRRDADNPTIPLSCLLDLSLRSDPGRKLSVVMREKEVVSIGDPNANGVFGVAVDVGSTTVVAYLLELSTGRELAVNSQLNPQIRHGDDVISRITYSMGNPNGRKELQSLIVECINQLIARCCASSGIGTEDVAEVMLVGNTAMHHSVFGLDQRALALIPFAPIASRSLDYKARDLGIGIAKEGYASALPNVAGFVGADHMAVLLATDMDELASPHMVIDIGTNGEISVGDKDGIFSASVAAGPAFEGGNLSCGMRGAEGAIDHVRIDSHGGLRFTTIAGKPPKGICGSGVIDLVAEMLGAGLIDRTGKLQVGKDPTRILRDDGPTRYVLVPSEEANGIREVSISQEDIVQIQFAKGALNAASEILMERKGISKEELHGILLAGAFGNYVRPSSARTLGMFPEVPLERIVGIGNAAGAGAKMALMSGRKRKKAEKLAKTVHYIELAAMEDFEDRFYSSMYFPHLDPQKFPEVSAALGRLG